MFIKVPTQDRH